MRLNRLRLVNFRQHVDSEIELASGLTGILGPNGAGKTTLLEAIAWAIYGASAARGTNDTIRFARAEPRSPVRVELDFTLAGHSYRVVRGLSSATVCLDGTDDPVATTITGVTDYLQQRLGMTRDEFFNTYFTGQKELQFLAQMGSSERARFLAQVLGYERLRLAQERARQRRNGLRHEVDGLRAGMADAASLRSALEAARGRREEARSALDAARGELASATSRLEAVSPKWEAAQAAQAEASRLAHERDLAAQEERDAARAASRAAEELESVLAAAAELEGLRAELAEMPALARECERLAELSRLAERRRVLAETTATLRAERAELEDRLGRLRQAPAYAERFRTELESLRAELAESEAVAERERDAWQQDRQEIRTRLQTYTDRTAELQQQLDQLRDAGPEGICPTCSRPLHDHYDQVMRGLEDEWETLVQDGKWLKKREAQLGPKPAALAEAEARRARLQAAIEARAEKLSRSEQAVEEASRLEAELVRRADRLTALDGELAAIPGDYDPARHREADGRLAALRKVERRAATVEATAARRERIEGERREAETRRAAASARGASAVEALSSLGLDPAAVETVRAEHQAAEAAVRAAELRQTEARGRLETAEEAVATAEAADADRARKQERVDELESERRHHEELDAALNRLRIELNARVRPELSELASAFLADITGGRYTALEIDEGYNVLVLDEGEEKPVISGGEEDVANLVLRLAISQMIAERAGHPLSVLILDEVFGSLDVERRDAVIQLLHGLTGRFEQVILISHIETIRDGLDQVVTCRFDERRGASVVE